MKSIYNFFSKNKDWKIIFSTEFNNHVIVGPDHRIYFIGSKKASEAYLKTAKNQFETNWLS